MLKFSLARLFQIKGINRPFSHFTDLGYSRNIASALAQQNIRSISVKRLEQLCVDLNCTPNDLFEFRPNPAMPLPADHALTQLIRKNNNEEIISLLHGLPLERIRELAAMAKIEYDK